MSDEQPADPTPEPPPAPPAPPSVAPQSRGGDAVTEGGYAYTVVGEPRVKQPKVKRESQPWRISTPVVAALIVVPALVVGVAAWFFSDAFGDDGGESDSRANANVASIIDAFSQGQTGRTHRIEGALPGGLPDDVPMYPGAEVLSSLVQVTGDDALYLVVSDTGDSLDDVTNHLDEALAEDPWQIDLGQDGVDASARQFSRIDDADIEAQYILVESKDADVTTIFLIVQVIAGADDAVLDDFTPPISKPLPEGFPADIPAYPDGIITETVFQHEPEAETFGLTVITRDSAEGALEFFRDDFEDKGWTVSEGNPEGSGVEDGVAITFESSDGSVAGSIAAGAFADDKNYTQIALQVRKLDQDED